MNLGEVLGVISTALGIIGSLAGAVWALLNLYFKKANALQELEDKNRKEALTTLATKLGIVETATNVFRNDLNDFRVKLTEHGLQLKEFDRISTITQRQWEKTASNLESRYQAIEGSELIRVRENTYIVKTKKT